MWAALEFKPLLIKQEDLFSVVFHPLLEDKAPEPLYMVNVMLEYVLALRESGLESQPFLDELVVSGLLSCGEFDQLFQLLQYKVIPVTKPLAFLLLASEAKFPASAQVATDILSSLGTGTEEVVEILLSKGHIIEALRFVESVSRNGGSTVGVPSSTALRLVEAAWASGDRHTKFTVFAYFQERSQRLKGTSHFAQGDGYSKFLYEFKRLYPAHELQPVAVSALLPTVDGTEALEG